MTITLPLDNLAASIGARDPLECQHILGMAEGTAEVVDVQPLLPA